MKKIISLGKELPKEAQKKITGGYDLTCMVNCISYGWGQCKDSGGSDDFCRDWLDEYCRGLCGD